MFRLLLVLCTFVFCFSFSAKRFSAKSSSCRSTSINMMAGRIPLIAGNWKMNTDLKGAIALANEVVELTKTLDPKKVEVRQGYL